MCVCVRERMNHPQSYIEANRHTWTITVLVSPGSCECRYLSERICLCTILRGVIYSQMACLVSSGRSVSEMVIGQRSTIIYFQLEARSGMHVALAEGLGINFWFGQAQATWFIEWSQLLWDPRSNITTPSTTTCLLATCHSEVLPYWNQLVFYIEYGHQPYS